MAQDPSHALPWWSVLRHRARRRTDAVEAQRYADEVSVAASRADDAAQRWQNCRRQAERHTDEAWHAWQEAEQRLTRTRTAAAFPAPYGFGTATEFADRERFMRRSVAAAVERGDLPATVMTDLTTGDGGWNPRLHPVEQELVLHRAIAAVRHHLYRQATATEATARHDAELARAARDSLRLEADAAATRAAALRQYLPARDRRVMPARRRGWVQQTA
ncbi:hypothetical protein [Actinoplanes aureus]|uniref:Uncharacterized protein n=1 Tax=Actinoplanes aureus TaxID=2792083 RepID=A0A931FZ81_9ACTN|nr:hypothetical protein [Actinoplanes aureus]MBG0564465.1 hypothetical protein [Actinoplanes aureus]